MADQRIASGHALGGQGQRQRHGRQQAFRHVGDNDADGEHHVGPERQANRLAKQEENDAKAKRQHRHEPRHPADFALQRRLGIAGRLGQMRDVTKLGPHPGGVHHGTALAGNDQRAGQQQAMGGQRVEGGGRLGRFAARLRVGFTGQRRQIDAQPPAFDQPAIGRHLGPFAQQ